MNAWLARLPWLDLSGTRSQALDADGLQVDGPLTLDGVHLTRSHEAGVVSLVEARIGGHLDLDNAVITNNSGPALAADRLRAGSNFRLDHAQLSGSGASGAVRLNGAHISGQLNLENAVITNDSGPLLILEDATVSGTAFISVKMICAEPTHGSSCAHPSRVALDGFTFVDLMRSTWWEWLHVVQCHTSFYRPQPYQQLAATERFSGNDNNARQILITQQQDLHKRAPQALGGWWTRRFHRLWGVLAGYGYRARRTAIALLLALLIAGALGFWAGQVPTNGNHRAAERTATFTSEQGGLCSTVELIGVGLDRGLPLSPTGVRTRCDLNAGTLWGQAFTVAIWLVQAAIWGLATLALAGYTGLIRKTA